MLSDFTLIAECSGGAAPGSYSLVGWPSFMGVFSGVAKGRFAITLNAVLSAETPQLAQSITLLLRSLFDTAPDFDTAMSVLTETPIAADCLLLVSGAEPGQMAVVERTSTKAEVRKPDNGLVVVTNDYRTIDNGFAPASGNELQATACSRFNRATALAMDVPAVPVAPLVTGRAEHFDHLPDRAATDPDAHVSLEADVEVVTTQDEELLGVGLGADVDVDDLLAPDESRRRRALLRPDVAGFAEEQGPMDQVSLVPLGRREVGSAADEGGEGEKNDREGSGHQVAPSGRRCGGHRRGRRGWGSRRPRRRERLRRHPRSRRRAPGRAPQPRAGRRGT